MTSLPRSSFPQHLLVDQVDDGLGVSGSQERFPKTAVHQTAGELGEDRHVVRVAASRRGDEEDQVGRAVLGAEVDAGGAAAEPQGGGGHEPRPGTRLPGRVAAAAPQASPSMRAFLPEPPPARNPASRESPAPTALTGVSTYASPCSAPEASTRIAPSAPRLARTARGPCS